MCVCVIFIYQGLYCFFLFFFRGVHTLIVCRELYFYKYSRNFFYRWRGLICRLTVLQTYTHIHQPNTSRVVPVT